MTQLVTEDMDKLRHMVGATKHVPKKNHGYRNHYAAGSLDQFESMERLVKAGFAFKGRKSGDLIFYHATRNGCIALGLSASATENVFS